MCFSFKYLAEEFSNNNLYNVKIIRIPYFYTVNEKNKLMWIGINRTKEASTSGSRILEVNLRKFL